MSGRVPGRGAGDYEEEEATTLDPFSIHESELVVVPKAGTDAIRDELRADPDVQDALRWLDPPSNAGPNAPPAAAVPPVRQPSSPPVRQPSSPPFAQTYTPPPQPYPGAGPYPTPVPGYVPNSGAYYLVTPMPAPAPPPPARSPILWIMLTALVTGGGIALGWWLFAQPPEPPAAARPQPPPQVQPPPQPAVSPSPTAPAVEPETAPQPAPAAATSVTAPITSLTSSNSVSIMGPMSGQVGKVFLAAPGEVAKGDKLLEIRYRSGGANARKLASRVAELARLAKDDPVYEEFLAEAREQQKAALGKAQTTVVMATSAGRARVVVKEGEAVAAGKPVAILTTGADWVARATAQAEVLRSWTCSVELPAGKRAACRIDKVVATASGSDITALISPDDAPWLEDVAQKPTLVLAPP